MKIEALAKSDLFYRDIEVRINHIKSKKNRYILLYRTTKAVVFIAGALITLLTGWKKYNGSQFHAENYVLVISSGITLLAALEGLFAFRDKGKGFDIMLFELRRLRDRMCFDYLKNPDLYYQNRDKHFEDYQKILESQKAIIENSDAGED